MVFGGTQNGSPKQMALEVHKGGKEFLKEGDQSKIWSGEVLVVYKNLHGDNGVGLWKTIVKNKGAFQSCICWRIGQVRG